MSFDPAFLLLSLVSSGTGFVLFRYGRKEERVIFVIGGILRRLYPYVVSTVTWLVLVGALIGAAVWFATTLGW